MNWLELRLRKVDAFQQKHSPFNFIVGVVKKYGDDNAGTLTTQLTYSMFVTVFPLLLLLVTVLNIVLANDPSIRQMVLKATYNQFPIVGNELSRNIHSLKHDSIVSFSIGLVGLIYGSTSLASSGLFVMEEVWNIEGPNRPNFFVRFGRGITFLVVLATGLVITTSLTGFGTYGKHNIVLRILSEALAALFNILLFLAAFRVLTPKSISLDRLITGAVVGGISWTILQSLGSLILSHTLRTDNLAYGVFGAVLGLLAWLYLGARVVVYSAEVNTVKAGMLWPRSFIQPPLTKADQLSIATQATKNRRREEQSVSTSVHGQPMTQAEFLENSKYPDNKVVGTIKRAPKDRQ